MGYLDEYLKDAHEDAAEDFKDGEDKKGKDEDDEIGYIHDLLMKHDAKLDELLKRTEHMSDGWQKRDLEDAEHKEDKKDEKEEKKEDKE